MIIETMYLTEGLEKVTLTAYILNDSEELLNGKNRPEALICPGGAYMFCSDREAEPVALKFNAMGYHAFVLRYSVYSNSGVPFPVPGKTPVYEPSIVEGPMREIGKAMLAIHEHAKEWKVDTSKIFLSGYSAGAHNCAMYSVYWNRPEITDFFQVPAQMLKPAAAVLGYGIYDYVIFKELAKNSENPMDYELFTSSCYAYMGNSEPSEEELIKVSPARQVTKDTPPMFLWATYEDRVVPVRNTFWMADALAKAKVAVEVHVYEKGDHGFSVADQSSAQAMEQIDLDIAGWVSSAQSWLLKRFALELPEKCPVWKPDVYTQ